MKRIVLALLLTGLGACRAMTAEVARQTTPEVVKSGIESAAQPENRRKIQEIVRDAPMKASLAAIDPAAVDTVIARLADPVNQQALQQAARTIAAALKHELSSPAPPSVQQQQERAAAHSMKLSLNAAAGQLRRILPQLIKDVASDPAVREAISPASRSATKGAVKGAADAVTGDDGDER